MQVLFSFGGGAVVCRKKITMKVVFKLDTGVLAADANVGQSNFKGHYPEVNNSTAWLELLPYIEQATDLFVMPYVGQAMYDAVVDIYQAGTPAMSTKQARFLELMQRTVAYYTVFHALPKKLAVVASMGAVTNSPNGGSVPVGLGAFKNQLWSVTKDADRFLDDLLDFLQTEANAGNAEFDDWKNAAAYTEGKSDYFRSTKEFQGYHNICRSHRTFLALLPYVKKAQDKYILPILGKDQHSDLVTAIKDNTATAAQASLIEAVRKCLAEWTIHMAVPALTVLIEEDGIKVVSRTDGMDTRSNVASAFYKEAAVGHQAAAEENARTFRADLINFLFENEADYPLWVASDFYTNATTTASSKVIGGECGGIWI